MCAGDLVDEPKKAASTRASVRQQARGPRRLEYVVIEPVGGTKPNHELRVPACPWRSNSHEPSATTWASAMVAASGPARRNKIDLFDTRFGKAQPGRDLLKSVSGLHEMDGRELPRPASVCRNQQRRPAEMAGSTVAENAGWSRPASGDTSPSSGIKRRFPALIQNNSREVPS